jgi:hypothetical protein
MLASGVSIRRAAIITNLSRGTVTRRLRYFGKKCEALNRQSLKTHKNKVKNMQFDDLITKENSKLKPLSVTIAVDTDSRRILGAKVSQIPSFGHLAKRAREKYGARNCYHQQGIESLFKTIESNIHTNAKIVSDEHKKYPKLVKKYFPSTNHITYKSERGCVAGQGELKKVKYDPLFAINHTCAMFRANINRLIRKTWCTTKDPERLKDHIEIFIYFYNTILIKKLDPIPTG